VSFIDLLLEHFFGVLIGDVSHHDVCSLFIACFNPRNEVIIYKFLIFLTVPNDACISAIPRWNLKRARVSLSTGCVSRCVL